MDTTPKRALKLQVQMSVDGYIAGPNGEMDWLTFDWDDDLKGYVDGLTEDVDCIVLGRKLAEGFIPHWAGVAADANNSEVETGKKFTDTPKIVFSRTLETSPWDNTVLATGDIVKEINSLKNRQGGDIIAYGGGEFVSSLLKHGLVDELYLFINPVALGRGMAIFAELEGRQTLELDESKVFACGIVLVKYCKAT